MPPCSRSWPPGSPDRPYNDLPPPPSADDLESRRVLKAAIGANAALAQLDQAVVSIPNPTVLINSIPILEAQASSEIENIVTTTDKLFRYLEDDANADPATRETLRYRTALRAGFDHTVERGITTATASTVCSIIMGREMKVRALPGTRIGRPGTAEVIYSPQKGAMSSMKSSVSGSDSSTQKTVSTH
ncbi:Fic/DOC family N-terminal domain-containing protein [Mycobacterium simulans]|uniref:Fic/DOC family N-terminal domain-containing protein n=1 Tax=Mycobacterium simulans TaxID=627089 RepID=UPI001CD6661C|nr:Fic/DOC family N-terminal domain-containing protein [Mycobacterium simulans]